jgi:hypothetical protein
VNYIALATAILLVVDLVGIVLVHGGITAGVFSDPPDEPDE